MGTILNGVELIKGQPYLVKHYNGKQNVRRIYRGEEKGVMNMQRFVFTAKVRPGVYAELERVVDKKGKETGVVFWKWKNTQSVPRQDISIPYYDIKLIHKA